MGCKCLGFVAGMGEVKWFRNKDGEWLWVALGLVDGVRRVEWSWLTGGSGFGSKSIGYRLIGEYSEKSEPKTTI